MDRPLAISPEFYNGVAMVRKHMKQYSSTKENESGTVLCSVDVIQPKSSAAVGTAKEMDGSLAINHQFEWHAIVGEIIKRDNISYCKERQLWLRM